MGLLFGDCNTALAIKTPEAMPDLVNHPAHYTFSEYEPIKVIRAWGLSFALGNMVKYAVRAGRKDPTKRIEDLKKARFYIDDEIAFWEQRSAKMEAKIDHEKADKPFLHRLLAEPTKVCYAPQSV